MLNAAAWVQLGSSVASCNSSCPTHVFDRLILVKLRRLRSESGMVPVIHVLAAAQHTQQHVQAHSTNCCDTTLADSSDMWRCC
jgi:hypothetical protein